MDLVVLIVFTVCQNTSKKTSEKSTSHEKEMYTYRLEESCEDANICKMSAWEINLLIHPNKYLFPCLCGEKTVSSTWSLIMYFLTSDSKTL